MAWYDWIYIHDNNVRVASAEAEIKKVQVDA
jgi:hypothetical protein